MIQRFSVITIFPDLFEPFQKQGVFGQAVNHGLIGIETVNPRDFSSNSYCSVDDRPYGGGEGMVMMAEPLEKAVHSVRNEDSYVVLLSAQGTPWTSQKAKNFTSKKHVVLVCGRYEGIDERFLKNVDEEISVGDYVLSGGELGAMILMDSIARYQPGVLGNSMSATKESFEDGLLEGPQFTRPLEYKGMKVPEVLMSGHHEKIQDWRHKIRILKTLAKRPDLLEKNQISKQDQQNAIKFLKHLSSSEKLLLGIEDLIEQNNTTQHS